MKQLTVKQFFKQFPTDEACLLHIFNTRFGQGHECPKCERSAKWYPLKAERAFSCQHCGHHLHPTVGTPFEASRTSLQSWFYAIYLFTTTRHGVPAKELQRQLGVTYKTAWRMGHKIREHMEFVDGDEPLSGYVEVDETFVGGKGGKPGRPTIHNSNKTPIVGMVERNGDVYTQTVPDTNRDTLMPVIKESIEKGSTIYSDEHKAYASLESEGYDHETVNHSEKEWARGDVHTNSIEGFWRQLKQGISGTHVHVSRQHLPKYTKEFEYRYNSRHNPEAMFGELVSTYGEEE